MNEELYCQGCGIKIQSEDQNESGYIPKSALTTDMDNVLCRRCFRLKNYNETQDVEITDNDFLQMVSQIRDKDGLVVHVIDIFDVDGSIIPSLSRIVGDNPIILVGNKLDLLPKSTNENQLNQWLRTSAKEAGLRVLDVFLISSTKGHGFDELMQGIEGYRNKQDVYVVGTTNVGKSTFINRIIKQATGVNEVITTSYFPGTTLGFIEIELDDSTHLIDTPGIVNRQQIAHYVSDKDLKLITPKKEVKARGYQLNSGQSLFIGGLARFDFIRGEKQSFICYFSNEIAIHRTKLENANDLYENHLGELLSPPNKESLESFPEFERNTFKLENEETDIVFPGLGWITIPEGNVTVEVHSPKGVSSSIRQSLL